MTEYAGGKGCGSLRRSVNDDLVKGRQGVKIAGLQKLTLLDYPGKMACTVFTYGCNFRCPYCHNASIVLPVAQRKQNTADGASENRCSGGQQLIDIDAFMAFLEKRAGMLDGVVVTGGEPTLQSDLAEFLFLIKEKEYLVKLDTNGSRPDVLKRLISAGLVDRVAMDIKASPGRYAKAVGLTHVDITAVDESVKLIMESGISYEFRTTLVKGMHDLKEMEDIAGWIRGAEEYYLQQFKDSGDLIAPAGLTTFDAEEMKRFAEAAAVFIPAVKLRGVD